MKIQNTKQEYSLFLTNEPDPNKKVALGFLRSMELKEIKNSTKFYFHSIEKDDKTRLFPEGILDSEYLFLYSGGRGKTPHFNGYYAKIKSVRIKHKSKIKGKEKSKTEYYYEVKLKSKFKLHTSLNAEIDTKFLFGYANSKESKHFANYLPAITTIGKVLSLNKLYTL